jgi:hypothetical protein
MRRLSPDLRSNPAFLILLEGDQSYSQAFYQFVRANFLEDFAAGPPDAAIALAYCNSGAGLQ